MYEEFEPHSVAVEKNNNHGYTGRDEEAIIAGTMLEHFLETQ